MSNKAIKRAKKLEEKLQRAREFEDDHEELIRTAEADRQTQSAPTTPYQTKQTQRKFCCHCFESIGE